MGKDPRESADKQATRAVHLFEAEQFKKAARIYTTSGDLYLKIHEFESARDCFYNAARSFAQIRKFNNFLSSLRNAGDASLFLEDFSEANDFFKSASKYVRTHVKNESERNENLVLFSALSYLCMFIKGEQDKGLNYLKQIKKDVDGVFFKENPLIRLVKNLTIAIRDKNQKYLDKVEQDFIYYKFREAEAMLVKKVLVLAKTHNSIITELKLDKEKYTTDDVIKIDLIIDTKSLIDISSYPFYNYAIKSFKIKKIGLSLSDNLIVQEKPEVPMDIKPGQKKALALEVKPHFQMDNSFIGPILLTCELDGAYIFFLKTQSVKPSLVSPPATLDISLKNLKTPLINQTFPMEILIENNSKGEAIEINMELELPKELKMMRGTPKKQIYNLKTNESMAWEINLKPLEAGDHEIKIHVKFKDPDSNEIEETRNFPFSIQL